MLRLLLLVILLIGVAACAGTGPARTSGSDVLEAGEVQSYVGIYRTAYQLIERSRPGWLRKRSSAALVNQHQEGDIVVYVNGMRMGGPVSLRDITLEAVGEMRYLNAARAVRYGMGHQHGVIEVSLR